MPKNKRFHSKHKLHHKLLTALGIGVSVILFWRGIWGLMDLYLFPSNLAVSYAVLLVIGFVVLYVTHYIVNELM